MREFLSQRGKEEEERVGFQPRDRKKVSYVLRMEVFDFGFGKWKIYRVQSNLVW